MFLFTDDRQIVSNCDIVGNKMLPHDNGASLGVVKVKEEAVFGDIKDGMAESGGGGDQQQQQQSMAVLVDRLKREDQTEDFTR